MKPNAYQFLFQLNHLTSFEGIDDSKQITVLSFTVCHFSLEMETFFIKKFTFEQFR